MDKAARDGATLVAAANNASTKPSDADHHSALLDITGACIRVAVAVFAGYTLAVMAWRARRNPQDLAFVAFASALLAALLACIRRAERLTPNSPARERRRVLAAVWALSAVLSCAFAYRVAAVMPPALAVLVWCMTATMFLSVSFCSCSAKTSGIKPLGDDASNREAYAKVTPHELV